MEERPYDEKTAYEEDPLATREMRLPTFDGGATAEMPKYEEPLAPWEVDALTTPAEVDPEVTTRTLKMLGLKPEDGVPIAGLPRYEKFEHGAPKDEVDAIQRQGEELTRLARRQIAPRPSVIQEMFKGERRKYENEILPGDNHANYQEQAKRYVRSVLEDRDGMEPVSMDDIYIVWFCKTLKNWKALIGTALADKRYYEVTYNGDTGEVYVDVYEKIKQDVFHTQIFTEHTDAKVLALMESGGLGYEMARHLMDTLKNHGILFHEKVN